MSKTGSALKGAAGGAVAGSAFGPWGVALGAAGGGIYGWLTDTSDEQAAAEKQKVAGMQAGASTYQGYRPQVMGARQQGLQQKLSAYGGAANAMGLMYGNGYNPANYAPDLGKLPDPSSYAPAPAPAPARPHQPGDTATPESLEAYHAAGGWHNVGREHTGPSTGADGYDAEKTKFIQQRTGRTDIWADAAGNIHQVGGTNAGIVSPF